MTTARSKQNDGLALSDQPASLPPLLPIDLVTTRLAVIFPEATPNRAALIGRASILTTYVCLYGGFVEGHGWLRPAHLYFFTVEQGSLDTDSDRRTWLRLSSRPGQRFEGERYYADTSREPLRDDAIKGLTEVGALVVRPGVATTSSAGRYALTIGFAALFAPFLTEEEVKLQAQAWRLEHLSDVALARIAVDARGRTGAQQRVPIDFPDGSRCMVEPGPSSLLSKAVIEEFARRHLERPAVLWLSVSGQKVRADDDALMRHLRITIDVQRALPDIVLMDVARRPADARLVFIEVVHTDGPIDERRKKDLLAYLEGSRFQPQQCRFITAFAARDVSAFKKAVPKLAWGTAAWFVAEPDRLLVMVDKPEGLDGSTSGP